MLFLEALMALGETSSVPSRYYKTSKAWVLTLTRDGRRTSFEPLNKEVFYPPMKSTREVEPPTAGGNVTYTFGVPKLEAGMTDDQNDARLSRAEASWEAFQMFTQLNQGRLPWAPALLKYWESSNEFFLPLKETNSADIALIKETLEKRSQVKLDFIEANIGFNTPILVRVEGESPEPWLDPAVMALHAQRWDQKQAKGSEPYVGQCGFCLEHLPLSRLSGGTLNFMSFQSGAAWTARGHEDNQLLNAPCCEACASAIARGSDLAHKKRLASGDGIVLLWWHAEEPSVNPWDIVDEAYVAFHEGADWEAKLSKLKDGFFASIETVKGRASLRRFSKVQADEVAARWAWWLTCLDRGRHVHENSKSAFGCSACARPERIARRMTGSTKSKVTNRGTHAVTERLYLRIICGEELPAKLFRSAMVIPPSRVGTASMEASLKLFEKPFMFKEEKASSADVEGLTAQEAMSFYLGCAFAIACKHQNKRKPQISLEQRLLSGVRRYDQVVREVQKQAVIKGRNGNFIDPEASRLLQLATTQLQFERERNRNRSVPGTVVQTHFFTGFYSQQESFRKTFKATTTYSQETNP